MQMRTICSISFNSRLMACLMLVASFIVAACASTTATITAPVATPSPTATNQQLQAQLEAQMKAMQVPGAVVFVQSARTGTWTSSLGIGNLATQAPINPNMHFRIGSITKTFTGTVILQLVDQGKLKLDDPVSKYQPQVPNGGNITIRELLDMRSGLYNYSEDPGFGNTLLKNPQKVWTPKELLAISFSHPPYFPPGKDFHYSNTNYIILGQIIEQIAGQPVENEFQQRIFKPLGMNNSVMPPRPSATIPQPYTQGYLFNSSAGQNTGNETIGTATPATTGTATTKAGTSGGSIAATATATGTAPTAGTGTTKSTATATSAKPLDVTTWNPSWGWTAGSAISTLSDMEIWSKELVTGKLLSPAMQKERLTWSTSLPGPRQYGLAIANFEGFIGHNGQIPGNQCFEGYNPQKKETIIVLTNLYAAPDGKEPADALAGTIMKYIAS